MIFFTPVGTIKFEVHVARHEAVEFINSKLESGQEFLATWIEPASEGKVYLLHSVFTSKKELECMICSCTFLPFNNHATISLIIYYCSCCCFCSFSPQKEYHSM